VSVTYGSVCSGAGLMDLGFEQAGLDLAFLLEVDPHCRAVLDRSFPGVPIYGDLRHADDFALPDVRLLAGGTPCQDFSVAGSGRGLDGERSGLFVDYIRLADRCGISWLCWENVLGCLYHDGGWTWSLLLEGFTGFRPRVPRAGWRKAGVCVGHLRWCVWRVLDARFFGVPQRRRRVFVVAGPRSAPAPEVLLEPEGMLGDSAPSTQEEEEAATVTACCAGGSPLNGYDLCIDVGQVTSGTNRSVPSKVSPCLTARADVIAFNACQDPSFGPCPSLGAGNDSAVLAGRPRRFTPIEKERLQGCPDGYTAGFSDTARGKMLGNGVAVPVASWLGARLKRVIGGKVLADRSRASS